MSKRKNKRNKAHHNQPTITLHKLRNTNHKLSKSRQLRTKTRKHLLELRHHFNQQNSRYNHRHRDNRHWIIHGFFDFCF